MAAIQLDALLEVAAASTAAGVVELTVDVANLNLTDPATLRALVALAAGVRASNGRLQLASLSTEELLAALQAASLSEVIVLWDALRGPRRPAATDTRSIRRPQPVPAAAACDPAPGAAAGIVGDRHLAAPA